MKDLDSGKGSAEIELASTPPRFFMLGCGHGHETMMDSEGHRYVRVACPVCQPSLSHGILDDDGVFSMKPVDRAI